MRVPKGVVIGLALLFLVQITDALPARVFTVKLPNAADIVSDSGHYNLIFVTGWVSNQDSLFRTVLTNASKTAAMISATGTYFDGDQLKNAWVVENTDVGHHLDRPWGLDNKVLLSNVPADTNVTDITVQFAIHHDDRVKQVLSMIQRAEPVSAPSVEPYLTYANLVDGYFSQVFGTDKTKYPFSMDAGLADPNIESNDGMYEHYLIAISPNKDGDQWLDGIDGTKLSYSSTSRQLTYEGHVVTDHTYAIFLIQKAEGYDVARLVWGSNAPWAVLALGSFYQALPPTISTLQDVRPAEQQYAKTLRNCTELLKHEIRFSAYDRAKAAEAFNQQAQNLILAGCKSGGFPNCQPTQLDAMSRGLSGAFGFKNDATVQKLANFNVAALNNRIKAVIQPY